MANSPEHKAAVTQRAALIAHVLAPLGNLIRLRQDIRENKAELKHALFYAWQCGYRSTASRTNTPRQGLRLRCLRLPRTRTRPGRRRLGK